MIKQKLAALERKIIVGGENLLDKAEEQERLLEESAKDLEHTIVTEHKLREQLEAKQAERLDIEEKYSSLQVKRITNNNFFINFSHITPKPPTPPPL